MEEFSTPLMRQYSAIKQRHPNALLLFRLGDFYELFFEDAVVAAKELQITLTSRNKEKGTAIPMCGVPYHAAEGYIAKLIRRGFRVAICDQMEDPRVAKKLVKREVTRVVTPGTAIDSQVLEPRENNYLASVVWRNGAAGLALVDLSTGDFRATEFCGDESLARLRDELDRMRPSELLLASGTASPLEGRAGGGAIVTQTPLDEWVFGMSTAAYKAYDFDKPRAAVLSPQVVEGLLRRKLRYRGVVVAAQLESQAVRGVLNMGQAAVQSLSAGCDMLLIEREASWQAMRQGIEDAVASGILPRERVEQSLARIRAAKKGWTPPKGPFSKKAWERLARRFEEFNSGYQEVKSA